MSIQKVASLDVELNHKMDYFYLTPDMICSKEQLIDMAKCVWCHSIVKRCVSNPTDSHIINMMWEDIAQMKEHIYSSMDRHSSINHLCNKLLEYYTEDNITDLFIEIGHRNGILLYILQKNDHYIVPFIKSLDTYDHLKSFMRNVHIDLIIRKIKPFVSDESNPYLIRVIKVIDEEEYAIDNLDRSLFNLLSAYIINDYAKNVNNKVLDALNDHEDNYEVDDYQSVSPITVYTYSNIDAQVICLFVSFLFLLLVFIRTAITASRGEPILKHWIIDSFISMRVVSTVMAPRLLPVEDYKMYIQKYNSRNCFACVLRACISIALLSYNKQVSLQKKSINGLIIEYDNYYEFNVKRYNVSSMLCYGVLQICSIIGLTGNIIFTL